MFSSFRWGISNSYVPWRLGIKRVELRSQILIWRNDKGSHRWISYPQMQSDQRGKRSDHRRCIWWLDPYSPSTIILLYLGPLMTARYYNFIISKSPQVMVLVKTVVSSSSSISHQTQLWANPSWWLFQAVSICDVQAGDTPALFGSKLVGTAGSIYSHLLVFSISQRASSPEFGGSLKLYSVVAAQYEWRPDDVHRDNAKFTI